MKDTSNRKWQITINNPLEKGYSHEKIKEILESIKGLEYWCLCDEVGSKEHTYHTHIFIYRPNPFRFSRVKKLFPDAHLESAKGTAQENRDYIRKEGKYEHSNKTETNLRDTFEESGEVPEEKQGKRNDLESLYDMIKEGFSDYEILEENPNYLKRLNDIQRCRELLRYEEFKNKRREVHCEYWYGDAGAGKTSGVFDKYGGYDKVYRIVDNRDPWDGYRGQDIVLFDDFRDWNFDISILLKWLDNYPLELRCRYANKQACFTKVYFTSNVPFDQIYTDTQRFDRMTWQAFCRRFDCIKEFKNGCIVDYKSMEEYMNRSPFLTVSPEQQKKIEEMFGT